LHKRTAGVKRASRRVIATIAASQRENGEYMSDDKRATSHSVAKKARVIWTR
jgi:hypothetical protein